MIKSILWDWNGTLLDDVEVNIGVVNQLLERRGLKTLTLQEYKASFRIPIQDFYRTIGLDHSGAAFDTIAREYVALYNEEARFCLLNDGVEAILAELKERGVYNYILSAMNQTDLSAQVASKGIKGYFKEIIGSDNIHAKSKTGNAEALVQGLKLKPEQILLVGDTLHDLDAARHIACQCLLYIGGHQELRAGQGYQIIKGMNEVSTYVSSY